MIWNRFLRAVHARTTHARVALPGHPEGSDGHGLGRSTAATTARLTRIF